LKPYHDFREMLRQPDLDAVIIATPPHWHTLLAIAACEAGKDIYLQKPMTLHLAESFAVRNAVKKHNRICQVGWPTPFGPWFITLKVRTAPTGPRLPERMNSTTRR